MKFTPLGQRELTLNFSIDFWSSQIFKLAAPWFQHQLKRKSFEVSGVCWATWKVSSRVVERKVVPGTPHSGQHLTVCPGKRKHRGCQAN